MENVILVIHLLLALCLIGIVLLQRSEGGGLGMGGDGGVSARGAATALTKLTWIFAIAFICTSIILTVFGRQNASSSSVLNGLSGSDLLPAAPTSPAVPSGDSLLPPLTTDSPLTPPRAE